MEREQSTASEWGLAALWVVLLVGTFYALAVDNDGLFQLMIAAIFLLSGLTLLVQKRLASKRRVN
ncbi:hypothetical protein ACFQJ5_19065 [Halomicroarcula sp. GCM10025324]|uniref:hypothetical protein n=1 Tax=Halomicroarcula sp. GCM10025324 TaxID=3252667 RepID=UPI003616B6F2